MTYRSTNKTSPCPCCSDNSGKCRKTDSEFKLPYWSDRSSIEGELILCMELRGDTSTHAYRGETKHRGWGKYITKELAAELDREWKPPNQEKGTDDPEKAAQIKHQLEIRRQQVIAKRKQEKLQEQKAEALERKVLLPEIERDGEIRKVIESLSISDRDFKELTKRGFSPDQIYDYDYKSIQVEQPLAQKTSRLLAGVTADGLNLNNKVSGMILPIPNEKGQYVGWQYKLNQTKNKYPWPKTYVPNRSYNITSKLKDSLEMPVGYFRPKSRLPKTDHIALTESVGFKPRLTADKFDLVTIGASGGMFTSSPQTFKKFIDTASKELNTNKVVIYGDAGAVENPLVLNRYHQAAEFLEKRGFDVKFAWWGQINKHEHSDIDEISTGTKIDLISPQEFFALGKQHSNWKATDSPTVSDSSFSTKAIADEFSSDLSSASSSSEVELAINRYQTKFGDRFEQIKAKAWDNLDSPTKQKVSELILDRQNQESLQQQRVDKIVPLLAQYLNFHKKHEIESDKSIIKYDKKNDTISYRDKINPKEYLNAKRNAKDAEWVDTGSSISEVKMNYFAKQVAPKIDSLSQKKSQAKSLQRSR